MGREGFEAQGCAQGSLTNEEQPASSDVQKPSNEEHLEDQLQSAASNMQTSADQAECVQKPDKQYKGSTSGYPPDFLLITELWPQLSDVVRQGIIDLARATLVSSRND